MPLDIVIADETGHKATSLLIVRLIRALDLKRPRARYIQQYDKPTNPYIDPVQMELSSFLSFVSTGNILLSNTLLFEYLIIRA